MSLNDILGSALAGLGASQAGLRTVSNNIANVGTPGYARERISQSPGITAGRTNGVVVGEPSRVADRFLEANVYRRAGDAGKAQVSSDYLERLQGLLGTPGASSGLAARLDAIGNSAEVMSGSPTSPETISAFTANVQDTIGSMRQLDNDVTGLRSDVESEVGFSVAQVNGLLTRIHDLNDSVARLQGLGRSTAGPADQRMSAIEELSGTINVNVREQPDGRVTIDTAAGVTLVDRRLRQLSYPTGGVGGSQPTYPPIDVRFADADGNPGPATGESLSSAAVGGKLGGLLDMRDRALPAFSEQLGTLFGGLAESLNAVSNAGTTVPAPARLDGGQTALVGSDRLGFTGAANFAVTRADGTLVANTRVNFDALGAGATVDTAVAAINAGLGGAGVATFSGGKLSIAATAAGNGVVVAQDADAPSARAGIGFAQAFGLNDLVRSSSALAPSGFVASDPHGFGQGETAGLVLRDATGRTLSSYTLTGSVGQTFGDLVTELNQSPLGGFGSFALDGRGRIQFQANGNIIAPTLSVPTDSTDRLGTGRSFSSIVGLTGATSGLADAEVRPDMLGNAAKLPLARLQAGVAVGQKALGAADVRGAAAFVDQLATPVDLGKDGTMTVQRFASQLLGGAGAQASRAKDLLSDSAGRRDDAISRRDNYSGVNVDEELSQMVVLQNSYSAAARVISTASDMYDTLIAMVA